MRPLINRLFHSVYAQSLHLSSMTSAASATELPSQVEETLAICPRFRIVLVGNTGVGKSSLVSSVFNIIFNSDLTSEDGTGIDIAHDCVGNADINKAYYSDQNPRFSLHDSKGFEPGSIDTAEMVRSFLQGRSEQNAELPDQVHAIWLCIETPRTGSRLLETGDEDLLKLAKELKIPVIVVLTKYDLLIMEHLRACIAEEVPLPDRKVKAEERAQQAFDKVTAGLKDLSIPFVAVTTAKKKKELREKTLLKLTEVTQENLRHVAGSLWALWATAQQINARQKVELSISEGFKKYWRDLGENALFQGCTLGDCIDRIHDDIIKVWNFNDPLKLLCGTEFVEKMIQLVEPVRDVKVIPNWRAEGIAGIMANVATFTGALGSGFVLPALGITMGAMTFQFLRNQYQKGASTATYISAYIVDLVLVLYDISIAVTADPPRSLTRDLVMDTLALYKDRSAEIHAQLKDVGLSSKPEEKVAAVIRDACGLR